VQREKSSIALLIVSRLIAFGSVPRDAVIIFTTNAAGPIPARLRDRCVRLAFESSALLLRPYLQELTDRIGREESCTSSPPDIETLGLADDNGNASFRRLVQKLTRCIRAGAVPLAPKAADEPEDRLHVYGRLTRLPTTPALRLGDLLPDRWRDARQATMATSPATAEAMAPSDESDS
jgi:hypothetical protein